MSAITASVTPPPTQEDQDERGRLMVRGSNRQRSRSSGCTDARLQGLRRFGRAVGMREALKEASGSSSTESLPNGNSTIKLQKQSTHGFLSAVLPVNKKSVKNNGRGDSAVASTPAVCHESGKKKHRRKRSQTTEVKKEVQRQQQRRPGSEVRTKPPTLRMTGPGRRATTTSLQSPHVSYTELPPGLVEVRENDLVSPLAPSGSSDGGDSRGEKDEVSNQNCHHPPEAKAKEKTTLFPTKYTSGADLSFSGTDTETATEVIPFIMNSKSRFFSDSELDAGSDASGDDHHLTAATNGKSAPGRNPLRMSIEEMLLEENPEPWEQSENDADDSSSNKGSASFGSHPRNQTASSKEEKRKSRMMGARQVTLHALTAQALIDPTRLEMLRKFARQRSFAPAPPAPPPGPPSGSVALAAAENPASQSSTRREIDKYPTVVVESGETCDLDEGNGSRPKTAVPPATLDEEDASRKKKDQVPQLRVSTSQGHEEDASSSLNSIQNTKSATLKEKEEEEEIVVLERERSSSDVHELENRNSSSRLLLRTHSSSVGVRPLSLMRNSSGMQAIRKQHQDEMAEVWCTLQSDSGTSTHRFTGTDSEEDDDDRYISAGGSSQQESVEDELVSPVDRVPAAAAETKTKQLLSDGGKGLVVQKESESSAYLSEVSNSRLGDSAAGLLSSSYLLHSSDILIDAQGLLGHGTFGSVYRGYLHGKLVAVKKLTGNWRSSEMMKDFEQEVLVMSKLHHPNILMMIGACIEPENLMIVTEMMSSNVYERLHSAGVSKPSLLTRLKWAEDTCLGMSWLHRPASTFLHMDLKTQNLLIDEQGTVKVSDFGLSEFFRTSHSAPTGSQTLLSRDPIERNTSADIGGTLIYRAPELLHGKQFDQKCDVYSFGIVLWELYTCEVPWHGVPLPKVIYQVSGAARARPEIPDECPIQLRRLIQDCWAHAPDERPHFSSILTRLQEVIMTETISAPTARAFWMRKFGTEFRIPWKRFFAAFSDAFGVKRARTYRHKEYMIRCLREMITDSSSNDYVSMSSFNKCVEYFGPLNEEQGVHFMKTVFGMVKLVYFHADLTKEEAEKVLAPFKKGTFLVRFSREPGNWTASVRMQAKGAVCHLRLGRGGRVCENFPSFLRRHGREHRLRHVCPCERFTHLFFDNANKESLRAAPIDQTNYSYMVIDQARTSLIPSVDI